MWADLQAAHIHHREATSTPKYIDSYLHMHLSYAGSNPSNCTPRPTLQGCCSRWGLEIWLANGTSEKLAGARQSCEGPTRQLLRLQPAAALLQH